VVWDLRCRPSSALVASLCVRPPSHCVVASLCVRPLSLCRDVAVHAGGMAALGRMSGIARKQRVGDEETELTGASSTGGSEGKGKRRWPWPAAGKVRVALSMISAAHEACVHQTNGLRQLA